LTNWVLLGGMVLFSAGGNGGASRLYLSLGIGGGYSGDDLTCVAIFDGARGGGRIPAGI